MSILRPRLEQQLNKARKYSEDLLAGFTKPEEWTYQVHPEANHAMWFAGHTALIDNYFVKLFAPQAARELPGYQEKFGLGSKPSPRPADYPPPAEVLEILRERRRALMEVLATMSDADLTAAPSPEVPPNCTDVASIFGVIAWHEGLHAGQASIARRALGKGPVFVAPPKPADKP